LGTGHGPGKYVHFLLLEEPSRPGGYVLGIAGVVAERDLDGPSEDAAPGVELVHRQHEPPGDGTVVDGGVNRRDGAGEEANPDRPLSGSNALRASQRSTKREPNTNCPGPSCVGEEGPTVHSAPSRQISA